MNRQWPCKILQLAVIDGSPSYHMTVGMTEIKKNKADKGNQSASKVA